MIDEVEFDFIFDVKKLVFDVKMIIEVLLMLKERRELKLIDFLEIKYEPVSNHFVDHVVIFYWHIVIIEYYVGIWTQFYSFGKCTQNGFTFIKTKILHIIIVRI